MKRFVRDLKDKDHLQMAFLAGDKRSGHDRNGKAFLSLALSDATGMINGRMFEKVDGAVDTFVDGDVVWVKGFVQMFQGRKQLIVQEIRKAVEGEYEITQLIARLGGDPEKHWGDLLQLVSQMQNQFVRQMLTDTLQDAELKPLLLRAPAAKTIHHAYQGGLIEHIHSIARMMVAVSTHYPFLDRDLLIFGAIFHDLGKVFELDLSEGIHYTRSGRLVGHMALACELIDRKSAAIDDFPTELKDVLKHIVLSHHGKLEYGSPKLPMIAEAVVVAMIDDLDSKMNTLAHFLKAEIENLPADESWSHYHSGFERYFYLDFFRQRLKE